MNTCSAEQSGRRHKKAMSAAAAAAAGAPMTDDAEMRAKAARDFKRAQNLKDWQYRSTIPRSDIDRAFAVLASPSAVAALRLLNEAIFGLNPAVSWVVNGSKKLLHPGKQTIISEYGRRFGRNVHRWLLAVGVVPIKNFDEQVSGLKMPFIPDHSQYQIHMIQNRKTRVVSCALWYPGDEEQQYDRSGSQGNYFCRARDKARGTGANSGYYDRDVEFYYYDMPSVDGVLRSSVYGLRAEWYAYQTAIEASVASDMRTINPETYLRALETDEDNATDNALRTGNAGPNQLWALQRSNYAQMVGGGGGGGGGGSGGDGDGEVNHMQLISQIRSTFKETGAGARVYTQIPANAEITNVQQPRSTSDVIALGKQMSERIAGVVGVPAAMLSGSVVSHGKGLEELHAELNSIVRKRADLIAAVLQRAFDVSYMSDRKDSLRQKTLKGVRSLALQTSVEAFVRAQANELNRTFGPPKVPPMTTEELQSTVFMTEEDFDHQWNEKRIIVTLGVHLRLTLERIRIIREDMDMITEEDTWKLITETMHIDRALYERHTGGSDGNGKRKRKRETATTGRALKAQQRRGQQKTKKQKTTAAVTIAADSAQEKDSESQS
jgi:hypothetical protein